MQYETERSQQPLSKMLQRYEDEQHEWEEEQAAIESYELERFQAERRAKEQRYYDYIENQHSNREPEWSAADLDMRDYMEGYGQ